MNWIKNILLVVLSSIITLLFGELALRMLMYNEIETFNDLSSKHRYIINGVETSFLDRWVRDNIYAFKLRPNAQMTITDRFYNLKYSFQTNFEGFRESTVIADNNKSNIMVLGDSVTFGDGVDQGFDYPNVMNSLLRDKISVYNFGVGAWSIAEYYLTYKRYKEKIKPDLVIIGIFTNDFEELSYTGWEGKEQGKLPKKIIRRDYYIDRDGHFRANLISYKFPILRNSYLWVYISKMKLESIYKWFKKDQIDSSYIGASLIKEISKEIPVLVLLFPSQGSYEKIIDILKNERNPQFESTLKNIDNIIKESRLIRFQELLTGINNIYILDFFPLIAKNGRYKSFYVDGSHFTKEGNYFVAESIVEFIKKNHLIKDAGDV